MNPLLLRASLILMRAPPARKTTAGTLPYTSRLSSARTTKRTSVPGERYSASNSRATLPRRSASCSDTPALNAWALNRSELRTSNALTPLSLTLNLSPLALTHMVSPSITFTTIARSSWVPPLAPTHIRVSNNVPTKVPNDRVNLGTIACRAL